MSEQVSRETDFYTGNLAQQIEQRRTGRRKLVRHAGILCSKCLERPPMAGQGYCKQCHADYERDRRKSERVELKRLRALEKQQNMSKGEDNGQVYQQKDQAAGS